VLILEAETLRRAAGRNKERATYHTSCQSVCLLNTKEADQLRKNCPAAGDRQLSGAGCSTAGAGLGEAAWQGETYYAMR